MRIKKVKIDKYNKISMSYEQRSKSGGGWDEYSFTCSEKARPEFYTVMAELAVDVLDMCELPEGYLEKIRIRGVSYSYGGENDTMGATISAGMELEYSYQELNLNTPHKASAMYNPETPEDEKQLLSSECVDNLKALHDECEKYIQGDRAQGTLFSVAS